MKYLYSIILLGLIPSVLSAYSDYDLDGVEDADDKCPNTLITDLVDIDGCTIKSLVSPHHFDIIVGSSYSQVNYNTNEKTNNINTSLQLDYYYKKFSVQLAASYFVSKSKTYSNRGLNDTYLSAYYRFSLFDDLNVRIGAGVILPTYDSGLKNNNVDYKSNINLSYPIDDFNLFGGYGYTLVKDDDIAGFVSYQNTNSFYSGFGYYLNSNSYLSLSYSNSESIYKGVIAVENLSTYAYHSFSKSWFSTINYAYGLSSSASDHYLSIRVGYYY